MKILSIFLSVLLAQFVSLNVANAIPSQDWLENMYHSILTCDVHDSIASKSTWKMKVYAHFNDWSEGKKVIKGYFVWEAERVNDEKQTQPNSSIMFPAEIIKTGNSFIINSSAEWAYSGYLAINNINVHDIKTGMYYRPEDNKNFTTTCFRHSDPR